LNERTNTVLARKETDGNDLGKVAEMIVSDNSATEDSRASAGHPSPSPHDRIGCGRRLYGRTNVFKV
jgi:hypothetical protein